MIADLGWTKGIFGKHGLTLDILYAAGGGDTQQAVHEKDILPVCGQPDVGREHKPKRVVTYEWNIDKHRDQREEGNAERNYVNAEKVENTDSCNTHIANLVKYSPQQAFSNF
jgi:hypothetical protein